MNANDLVVVVFGGWWDKAKTNGSWSLMESVAGYPVRTSLCSETLRGLGFEVEIPEKLGEGTICVARRIVPLTKVSVTMEKKELFAFR
jgi:hypothetical protein